MALTPTLFTSAKTDDTDPGLAQASHWNQLVRLVDTVFDGTYAAGSWSSLAASIPIGSSGNARFMRAKLSDNGAVGHFNFCVGSSQFAGDLTRNDHVLSIGYNVTTLGGRDNTNEPSFGWLVEDYYAPGGGDTNKYLESYWEFYNANGTSHRPISVQVNRSTSFSAFGITADAISFLRRSDGTQYFKWQGSEIQLINGTVIEALQNNYVFLYGLTVGGALVPVCKVDASDYLVLGGSNAAGLKLSGAVVTPASSGKRYLVIDSSGVITSQTTAPVGT